MLSLSDSIVAEYLSRLEGAGSRLLHDERSRAECAEQARSILSDAARTLRGEQVPITFLSRRIGSSRAAGGIHPSESLRAASVLFEVATFALGRAPEAQRAEPSTLLEFVLVLNRLVSQRIRMAASAYMGFLLEGLEQAHLTERKRISREIHDRLGGNLSAAHRQIEISRVLRERDAEAADAAVAIGEEAIRHTLHDVRCLVLDLRTWEFSDSLEVSLNSYLEHSRPAGMKYALSVNGDESRLPKETRGEVFLVIREAVRNAIRHAAAATVHVQVNITPHELYAVIEDDGVGVPQQRGRAAPREAGLASMRERAALLEGELVLTSELNRGTRVELLVPLPPTPASDDS